MIPAISILATRTPGQFKAAHVLMRGDDFWCLDLDVHGASEDELKANMAARGETLEREQVLPAAEDPDAWAQFSAGVNDHVSKMRCAGSKFGILMLIFRRPKG